MIDENGKVIFNEQEQAELDRIVGERLARVKKEEPEDYQILKEISKELEEFEFTGTPKEQAEKLRQHKQAIRQQAELEQLQKQAEDDGITPALAKKIQDLEGKLEESYKVIKEITGEKEAKKKEVEQAKAQEEAWNKQVKEFEEAYDNIDINELDKNPKFIKFIKGKQGTLKELYDDFVDFVGETEAETIAKVTSKNDRSTGSGKSSSADGGGYGLTDRQKNLAKKSGMTYKEYSGYLAQVTN